LLDSIVSIVNNNDSRASRFCRFALATEFGGPDQTKMNDRAANDQTEMHASEARAIENTIRKQWLSTSMTPEPCSVCKA
jgi:hypothetical protein